MRWLEPVGSHFDMHVCVCTYTATACRRQPHHSRVRGAVQHRRHTSIHVCVCVLTAVADVLPLCSPCVFSHRYLLLDGRSNTEIRGIKGLGQLAKLKTLIMPLLHLHLTSHTLLSTLQLSLPGTHIMNVSRVFGTHHGCQWFRAFTAADREWWVPPAQPWCWHPALEILP